MRSLLAGLAVFALFACVGALPAQAHTPDISTAKIEAKDKGFVVDVGFLATDLERMFQESMGERKDVDLAQPGASRRRSANSFSAASQCANAAGKACPGAVEHAGEDPTNQDSALVVLRFDCEGLVAFDATKLLQAQGPRGKELVTLLSGPNGRRDRARRPEPAGRSDEAARDHLAAHAEIRQGRHRAHSHRL